MSDDLEDVYELSPLQQGMLLHCLHGGDADTYVAQHSFAIDGPLEPDLLSEAWQATIDAHTALRTSFHWDDMHTPLQVVHRHVPVRLRRHDWTAGDEAAQRGRLECLLADARAGGFDPARAPLLQLDLVRLADERHVVVWTHHMLPVDGWSVPIVIGDVVRRYRSLTDGHPPPPLAPPYRDYIAWLQRQDLGAAAAFWTDTLGATADVRPLAPLRAARHDDGPAEVGDVATDLGPELTRAVRALAARERVTVGTVVQAAWALVLQRYTGGTHVQFGIASSGRPSALRGVDRMVGTFVNSLPLRLAVPDDGELDAWLREIQARLADARRYEHSPLSRIKRWAGVPATQPLFDSLLVLENYRVDLGGGDLTERLSLRSLTDFEKTSEPLTVFATFEPDLALRVLYHRDRLADGSAHEIVGDLAAVFEALTGDARIGRAAAALGRPDPDGHGPCMDHPDATASLTRLVERQAAATPDAAAVISDDGALTYADLRDAAQRVGAALDGAGVSPGDIVGVCAERGADLVVGIVGVLLAGAAYLPLDPSLPAARLALQRDDAGVDVIVATASAAATAAATGVRTVVTVGELPPAPAGWARRDVGGGDAAYLMYTSGSTGRPKGVVISHDAIVNRLLWMQDTFRLTAQDRVLHKTPYGFDVSVWELFWPLMTGATMVVARPGGHTDAAYLAHTIADQRVTTAHFVPSMLHLFLDEPAAAELEDLRRIVCSGEALSPTLARRTREALPDVELHNLYGPTEAAIDVTWWHCADTAPDVVPIGAPIANTQALVLDRRLREAPPTVPGELYLGGVQLARGYHARSGLTATTFVAHPMAGYGGRLYRTGDAVRRLPDGALEFLGRIDRQVKLHGYRIELGEIEQALADHPAVSEAAVIVRDLGGRRRLAAYVTATADEPDPAGLRARLSERLPAYMLPATVTVLTAMPVTHNGKLDRAALPDPSGPAAAEDTGRPPATPAERAVAEVFADVLGVDVGGVDAHFFDLGGTSFDAVRAIRRIEGASVALITAHPTVAALAEALERPTDAAGPLLRLGEAGAGRALVCVPFGGGSAIAYRQLAGALPPDITLHAVTLPGHEPGGDRTLAPVEDAAAEAAQAVLTLPAGPVAVYGHCAGVAAAVEIVRRVEAAGRPVERLFLAASYPFYAPRAVGRMLQRGAAALVRAGVLRVSAATIGTSGDGRGETDRADMRYLRSIGGFANDVDDETLAFVMRAFRHDVREGGRYLSGRWSRRAADAAPKLRAPITFIAGTDDPLTPRYDRRVRMWDRYSDHVDMATVDGGQHYFLQQQADELAAIIATALDPGGEANARDVAAPSAR